MSTATVAVPYPIWRTITEVVTFIGRLPTMPRSMKLNLPDGEIVGETFKRISVDLWSDGIYVRIFGASAITVYGVHSEPCAVRFRFASADEGVRFWEELRARERMKRERQAGGITTGPEADGRVDHCITSGLVRPWIRQNCEEGVEIILCLQNLAVGLLPSQFEGGTSYCSLGGWTNHLPHEYQELAAGRGEMIEG